MREQAAAGRGARGRHQAGGAGRGRDSRFDGVRVNLFDIFRFGPGERENLGIPKARYDTGGRVCARGEPPLCCELDLSCRSTNYRHVPLHAALAVRH